MCKEKRCKRIKTYKNIKKNERDKIKRAF